LDTDTPAVTGRGQSPSVAALLSFVWPGLGQFYTGKRRLAAIFAVPAAVVTLVVILYILWQGPLVFAARVFAQRAIGLAIVAIVVLFGAWRLVSVALAYTSVERLRASRVLDRGILVALATVIVLSHLAVGGAALAASNTGDQWFNQPPSGDIAADLATPTLAPGQTPAPTPTTPVPTIDSRVTILFTGDGQERPIQYDSIMVVSFDPKTNSVQMVSVPRDTIYYPLYFGNHHVVTTFRINSLPRYASLEGTPDSPYMTLVNEVSYLIGIHIDYYAIMDLTGFAKMIDLAGGIDVVNPSNINDPNYDYLDGSPVGFSLAAGPQHLNGRSAMAYVRSRDSAGQQDFSRSSRQQDVLIALLHKMASPDQILNLPSVMSTLAASVATNFPADKVADYISIGQNVPKQNIRQVVLTVASNESKYVGTAVCLYRDRIAQLSRQLFGTDSLFNGQKDPANICP
jgi:LCP family protein required for cell wall assembly